MATNNSVPWTKVLSIIALVLIVLEIFIEQTWTGLFDFNLTIASVILIAIVVVINSFKRS